MKKVILFFLACITIVFICSCGKYKEEKNTLDIIGFEISDEEEEFIQQFRISHPGITINVTDYAQFGDKADGLIRMNADIMAKKCGDIVIANTLIPIDSYIDKALLWNMNEADGIEEMKETILPNIIESCQKDEQLYSIFPDFNVYCFAGKRNIVEESLWNEQSICDVLSEYQKSGVNLFNEQSRGIYQNLVVQMLWQDINNNGMLTNDEIYINLLENARKLIKISDSYGMAASDDVMPYRKGEVALSLEIIDSFEFYYFLKKAKFDDDVILLGYPLEKNLPVFDTDIEFSIFNCSDNKELAWEFVSYYFSEEYQNSYIYGTKNAFPVNKEALQKMYEIALGDKSVDDEGNFTINKENSFYIGEQKIDMGIPTEKDLASLLDIIYSMNTVRKIDVNLMEIVDTELSEFWESSDSADETYGSIKSMVELYISESE